MSKPNAIHRIYYSPRLMHLGYIVDTEQSSILQLDAQVGVSYVHSSQVGMLMAATRTRIRRVPW